jgi:hypothetical protein
MRSFPRRRLATSKGALLPLCIVVALWAAASSTVPAWTAWLVPGGLAVLFLVAWERETSYPGGDPHPGALVAVVGLLAVAVVVAAILVGYVVRRHRSR